MTLPLPSDSFVRPEMPSPVRHVVHLIYRLTTGGLENVVVQLINNLPHGEFRHTVVSITDADPLFVQRIARADVEVICLHKPPGQPFGLYPQTYRLLRRLQPDVVHTCNLAALEFMPMAALAGVPLRVHAEHGMDMGEINTKGSRYLTLRKLYKPFVHEFIAVSEPLHGYLQHKLGVPPAHVHLIPNGVDTQVFRPALAQDPTPPGFPFQRHQHWVIGTVGRQVHIKNPLMLVDAFISLAQSGEAGTERMRLAMVGDGPLQSEIAERLRAAGLEDKAWLPGVRSDVAEILRSLDCFVLPSLSEGTSCTLQEAMATGLPIVVTDVGGNAELLEHGASGALVASGDVEALKSQLLAQLRGAGGEQAASALNSAYKRHSLSAVIRKYRHLFLGLGAPRQREADHRQRVVMSGPLPPAIGGMASVIGALSQSALARETDLVLFDTGKKTAADRTLLQGIQARLRLIREWSALLAGQPGTIAHIHTCSGFTYFLDGILAAVARKHGCRVMLHVHGGLFDAFLDGLNPVMLGIAQHIARRADLLIALSEDWKERLEQRLPGGRIAVLQNGVAELGCEPQPGTHERPTFVFLGNLSRLKGVDVLLDAVEVAKMDWHVQLAGTEGEPGFTRWVQNEIALRCLSERITVLGPVVGEAKRRLLAQADAFVLPSLAEGLPMALLEAMAARLPVVATEVGAIPEVIAEGIEGFLVPPGDSVRLALSIDRLAQSTKVRSEMGRAAYKRYQRVYSIDAMVVSLQELYQQTHKKSDAK